MKLNIKDATLISNGKSLNTDYLQYNFTQEPVRGTKMNQACLATFFSEALMFPNVALQSYIKWTEIDDLHTQATITYKDISVSGIFTFDDKGLVLSYETNDRYFTNPDGSMTQLKWTAKFDNYVSNNDRIQPTSFKAIWNYPEKDFIYFDANNINIQ